MFPNWHTRVLFRWRTVLIPSGDTPVSVTIAACVPKEKQTVSFLRVLSMEWLLNLSEFRQFCLKLAAWLMHIVRLSSTMSKIKSVWLNGPILSSAACPPPPPFICHILNLLFKYTLKCCSCLGFFFPTLEHNFITEYIYTKGIFNNWSALPWHAYKSLNGFDSKIYI